MKRRAVVFGRKGAAGRKGANATGPLVERAERRPLMRPATLVYLSGQHHVPVSVRDLSETGARIVADRALPATDAFDLRLDGWQRPCRIVWQEGAMMGVRFAGPERRL